MNLSSWQAMNIVSGGWPTTHCGPVVASGFTGLATSNTLGSVEHLHLMCGELCLSLLIFPVEHLEVQEMWFLIREAARSSTTLFSTISSSPYNEWMWQTALLYIWRDKISCGHDLVPGLNMTQWLSKMLLLPHAVPLNISSTQTPRAHWINLLSPVHSIICLSIIHTPTHHLYSSDIF